MIEDEDLQGGGIEDTDAIEARDNRHAEIVRYYDKDIGQNYTNIIEKSLQFLYDEFMISMVFIGIFNVESMKFNKRRIFWYGVCSIIIILVAIFGVSLIALIAYIASIIGK